MLADQIKTASKYQTFVKLYSREEAQATQAGAPRTCIIQNVLVKLETPVSALMAAKQKWLYCWMRSRPKYSH